MSAEFTTFTERKSIQISLPPKACVEPLFTPSCIHLHDVYREIKIELKAAQDIEKSHFLM